MLESIALLKRHTPACLYINITIRSHISQSKDVNFVNVVSGNGAESVAGSYNGSTRGVLGKFSRALTEGIEGRRTLARGNNSYD